MPFTLEDVPCPITGETYPMKVPAGQEPPDQSISDPALVALSILYEHSEYKWAKAAVVKHPNGTKEWITEHPGNTEDFEDFCLEHGAIYQSDLVEGFREFPEDSDPYARYQGHIDGKIREGLPGFRVTRSDLTPEIRKALKDLREQLGQASEAKSTSGD